MYELIFSVQELILPVQEFHSKSHMPLRAAEKSHMPLHAKHKRSNMAARADDEQLNTGIAPTSGLSENMGLVGGAHSHGLIILVSV